MSYEDLPFELVLVLLENCDDVFTLISLSSVNRLSRAAYDLKKDVLGPDAVARELGLLTNGVDIMTTLLDDPKTLLSFDDLKTCTTKICEEEDIAYDRLTTIYTTYQHAKALARLAASRSIDAETIMFASLATLAFDRRTLREVLDNEDDERLDFLGWLMAEVFRLDLVEPELLLSKELWLPRLREMVSEGGLLYDTVKNHACMKTAEDVVDICRGTVLIRVLYSSDRRYIRRQMGYED